MLITTTPYGMATTVTGYTTNTIALISTGTIEDTSTADVLTAKGLSAKGTHVADMTTTEVNTVDGTVIVTAGGKK
jgi:hypothetical protein